MNIEKVTPPIFVESDETSILLVWQTVPGADCYELQISEDLGGKWIILSSTIKSNSIRKKNLISQLPNGYVFRMKYCIRSNSAEEWSDVSPMSKPMFTQSAGNEVSKMEPPILLSKDAISVTISWAVVYEASGYIIRYRESSSDWTVITSPVAGISVRKKGLSEGKQYYFSVKPANLAEYEFSMSSQPFTVVLCSPKIKSIFPPKLSFGKLKNEPTTTLLAGKIVAIYFSAHCK